MKFLHDNLDGILPHDVLANETSSQTAVLLAPDRVETSEDPKPETNPDLPADKPATSETNPAVPSDKPAPEDQNAKTARQKRFYFLKHFIPFLQSQLARKNVVDTITAGSGFNVRAVARILLMDVMKMSTIKQTALAYILDALGVAESIWQGYISVPTKELYKFYLPRKPEEAAPEPFVLEGITCTFNSDTFGDVLKWTTESIEFDSQQVYTLRISQKVKEKLEWKPDTGGALAAVPKEVYFAWRGFILPLQSERYTFSVTCDNEPPPIEIENTSYKFTPQQQKPQVVWATTSIRLEPSKLYSLKLRGVQPTDLFWKPSGSVRVKVPDSALLPDYAQKQLYPLLEKLKKMALLFNRIPLMPDEILYIDGHRSSFANLDFNDLNSLQLLERLYNINYLKETLPKNTDRTLFDLFAWAETNENASPREIADRVADSTGWPSKIISPVLEQAEFSTGKALDFLNEIKLLQLMPMIEFAKRVDIAIPLLYQWASPPIVGNDEFAISATISQDIQKAARSKFDLDAWPKAVRPVNDVLREAQKNALTAYLLAQQDFVRANNIINADSLFEFFLVDVQTTPLVETSRIKQAISSVQLFIQRAMLGLEADRGVKVDALDRGRWEWMQKYRVWEANRKVYLYPENWIDPLLRDGKTEIFRQLEADLLQKNLTTDTVGRALKDYLYQVDHISNMQAIGVFVDYVDNCRTHIISRTRGSPYGYYHNWFLADAETGTWNSWEKIDVDIPHYTNPFTGHVGNYVTPVVYNRRLLLFIAQITPCTTPNTLNMQTSPETMRTQVFGERKAIVTWDIRLAWTEKRDGKWLPKKMCAEAFTSPKYRDTTLEDFVFLPALIQSSNSADATGIKIFITQSYDYEKAPPISGTPTTPAENTAEKLDGSWLFTGTELILTDSTAQKPTKSNPLVNANWTMRFGQYIEKEGDSVGMPALRSQQGSLILQEDKSYELVIPNPVDLPKIASDNSLIKSSDDSNIGGILSCKNSSKAQVNLKMFHKHMSLLVQAAASGDDATLIIQKLSSLRSVSRIWYSSSGGNKN